MATDSQEAHYGPYGPYGPVFQIVPGVQSYDWGLLGKGGSFVAKYAQATDELEFKQDDEKPYAEVSSAKECIHATLVTEICSAKPVLRRSRLTMTCRAFATLPALDGHTPISAIFHRTSASAQIESGIADLALELPVQTYRPARQCRVRTLWRGRGQGSATLLVQSAQYRQGT